jgi:predicted dehydrogenase
VVSAWQVGARILSRSAPPTVTNVVAVADIHEPADPLAAHLGDVPTFTTLERAVAVMPHIEVAVILASPERHAELIATAHHSGLDIITEKPAATDLDGLQMLRCLPPDFREGNPEHRYEAQFQTRRRSPKDLARSGP